jgi:7,8-dihydropterin-6-yl-methyl-4-(beta-D-ribofuranosyl)aminobenzene 5'-phosphate synthase
MSIGELARLRLLCVSEVGWNDSATLLGDIQAAGGMHVSQYELPWPPFGDLHADNAAGSSALIEAEELDGTVHRILFDSGWNPHWMERRFSEEGINRLLQERSIECLVISHEHFDHFWGIGAALQYCPNLTIFVPEGFQPEGRRFIKANGHTGQVIEVPPAQPLRLFAGSTLVQFPMSTLLQVQGENVLYFNVRGRGLVMVTGCGHGGVLNLLDYARRTFSEGARIHAVYGGLHLSPFEDWDEKRDAIIGALRGYGIEHFGCNHCTGVRAVEKMVAAGLPVLRGSARNGPKTDLFLGNGDSMEVALSPKR